MRAKVKVSSIVLCLLLALGAFAVSSCATSVTGSGKVISEVRDVEGFSEIQLSGTGNVNIRQGGRELLRIEAEDNIMPYIVTQVSGDRLIIRYRRTGASPGIVPTKPINFFVTVRNLNDLRLSGSAKVESGRINTELLRISTSGSGEIDMNVFGKDIISSSSGSSRFDLSGRVDRQSIDISGSGRYLAEDLVSKECDINISGSGSARVNVSDRLDVDISGSGDVAYIGDPEVNQRISGSGRIQKLSK